MPKKKDTEEIEKVEAEVVETNDMVKAIALINIKYHDLPITAGTEFDLLKEDLDELSPYVEIR